MRGRHSRSPHRSFQLAERARVMRWAPTPSEERLWSALRSRQLGVEFRRQVVIGEFIVDFLAAEGGSSSRWMAARTRGASAPARRDRELARAGYRVVRVSAESVVRDFGAAIALLRAAPAV